ncbi:armadillo-type protein [Mycena epipterygia]|nr:armadillo-type protein [Mycena epipterygia]
MALLESPNARVREDAAGILGTSALHESVVQAVLVIKPCVSLVSLLRDVNIEIVEEATRALGNISLSLDGAQAAVDAKVLEFVMELIESPNARVRECAAGMLANLARHESVVQAILAIKPCVRLVSLLQHGNIEKAACALCNISLWPAGAQAVVEANTLEFAMSLLESAKERARYHAAGILANLAMHESVVQAVLAIKSCVRLVSLTWLLKRPLAHCVIFPIGLTERKLLLTRRLLNSSWNSLNYRMRGSGNRRP